MNALRVEKRTKVNTNMPDTSSPKDTNNRDKTCRDFIYKWLPFYERSKGNSVKTYDSKLSALRTHILPYFGHRIMSRITAEEYDDFIDFLGQKPCGGSKAYNKKPEDIPTLSSSSVIKNYMILSAALPTAKDWGYITEIPKIKRPSVKTEKRAFWMPETVFNTLEKMSESAENDFVHLCVHLAFICSLRAGETAGILVNDIDLRNQSVFIKQEIQRCTDEALERLPKSDVVFVFPKQKSNAKTSLVVKGLKTEKSERTAYFTRQLAEDVQKRLEQIERDKAYYGETYNDYGLLLCWPNGNPMESINLGRMFKKWQIRNRMSEGSQIDFQGLRKSGQMHKIRLSQFNYQLVASLGGHSPEVLMNNYDEALETEKRALANTIEANFYTKGVNTRSVSERPPSDEQVQKLASELAQNPQLLQQAMQLLLNGTQSALGSKISQY
jgi:integrase